MTEGFYILEGVVNLEHDPARFLLQVSPGGFERYVAELSTLIAQEDTWPPEEMTPVRELMERHDTFAPSAA